MPESSLYQVISRLQQNDSTKRAVGYTVDAYNGILSSLERMKSASVVQQSVLGKYNKVDWEKVASSVYDDSGFSNDLTSGLWKMVLTFHGAFPIKDTTYGCYEILSFPNDNEQRATIMDSHKQFCPYYLNREHGAACPSDSFKVGAFIDLSKLGVNYFNHYYSNPKFKFNEEKVNMLFREGYLMAQIVFPTLKKYKHIKVIGHTAISDNACISVSSPILATSDWSDIDIKLYVLENSKTAKEVAPNGDEYKFVCAGAYYNYNNATIDGFTKEKFLNDWISNTSENFVSSGKSLSLQQIPLYDCYVRLYVPDQYRGEVLSKFGQYHPNDFLFQESFSLVYSKSEAAEYSGLSATIVAASAARWSSTMKGTVKGNTGKIYYSTNGRPQRLVRNTTYHYSSSQGNLTPTFGHNSNVYDCSSFVSMVMWDSGIVRDDVQSVPAFTSEQFSQPTIVDEINKYLKPQYQAVFFDLTDESYVMTGDIIVLTKLEKLKYHNQQSSFGHAEMALMDSNGKQTIGIGSNGNGPVKRKFKPYTYYKHIIRIVDKIV